MLTDEGPSPGSRPVHSPLPANWTARFFSTPFILTYTGLPESPGQRDCVLLCIVSIILLVFFGGFPTLTMLLTAVPGILYGFPSTF